MQLDASQIDSSRYIRFTTFFRNYSRNFGDQIFVYPENGLSTKVNDGSTGKYSSSWGREGVIMRASLTKAMPCSRANDEENQRANDQVTQMRCVEMSAEM